MKDINYALGIIVIAIMFLAYNQNNTYNTLNTNAKIYAEAFAQIDDNFEAAYQFIKNREELAISREHAIQDALEERIGTLEHQVESLQHILGKRK